MSARGFKAVYMTGVVASAALGCYLISLKVASERAQLDGVESKISLAQRDIRLLQTEIGTRGRLAQLERWNANFIQLSAPQASQFVDGGFQLATLAKPADKPAIDAPVVYAAAPAPPPSAPVGTDDSEEARPTAVVPPAPARSPAEMMHVASYSRPIVAPPSPRPALSPPVAVAKKPPVKFAEARPVGATNARKSATADPLAPLPGAKAAAKAGASRKPKDSGTP
jgi:hypothetical protein